MEKLEPFHPPARGRHKMSDRRTEGTGLVLPQLLKPRGFGETPLGGLGVATWRCAPNLTLGEPEGFKTSCTPGKSGLMRLHKWVTCYPPPPGCARPAHGSTGAAGARHSPEEGEPWPRTRPRGGSRWRRRRVLKGAHAPAATKCRRRSAALVGGRGPPAPRAPGPGGAGRPALPF